MNRPRKYKLAQLPKKYISCWCGNCTGQVKKSAGILPPQSFRDPGWWEHCHFQYLVSQVSLKLIFILPRQERKWNFAYMCMVGRGTYGPQDIQDFSHWELETVTWLHLGAGKLGNAVPGCAATSQGHPTLRKGCMKSVGQPPISAIHLLYYQLFEGRIVSFHAFTLVSFIHILRCWHQTDV